VSGTFLILSSPVILSEAKNLKKITTDSSSPGLLRMTAWAFFNSLLQVAWA